MAKLNLQQLAFLRDVHQANPRMVNKMDLTKKMTKAGLIVQKDGRSCLTDSGLDALVTHQYGDKDTAPAWLVVFKSYIKTFKDKGLLALFSDAKHDMKFLVNRLTPFLDDSLRLWRGSFEGCPLSYRDGKKGSFSPKPHCVEHTQNSFVEHWDEVYRADGRYDQKLETICIVAEALRQEILDRGLKEHL